jgi:hypothetical protein
MRAHGITNLPDPTVNGHGIGLQRGGIDLNSPQFRAAQQACHIARLLTKGGTRS